MSEQRPPTTGSWRPLTEGLGWVIAAIVLLVTSVGFNEPLPMFDWGPAFWPRIMLFGMIIAALALMATAFIVPSGGNDAAQNGGDQNEIAALKSWDERIHMALIFAVPVLYVYAMHKMGFLLITPIFLVIYMYIFGVRRWKILLIVAFSVYTTVVLVFVKLIFTPLPQGSGMFYTINGYLLALLQ